MESMNSDDINMNNPVSPSPIGQPKKPFNIKLVLILAGAAALVAAGVWASALTFWSPGGQVCWPYCPGMTDEDREGIKKDALEAETADWQTYRNEEYGFEIKYPNGLTQIDRSVNNNLSVEIKDEKFKTGDDGSSDTIPPYKKFPNWQIFIYHNSGDKCIFTAGEEEKKQGLSFKNIKMISGATFYAYSNYPEYIGAYCGMSGGCTYKDIYRTLYKNVCYQIQLNRNEAAYALDSNKTMRYLEQFNQILSTFKFTPLEN